MISLLVPVICKPTRNLNIQLTKRLAERKDGRFICTNKFARQLLDSYLEKSIKIDVRTFTAAMQICHENQKFEDVLSIFELMKLNNVTSDRISLGIAVTSSMHLNDHQRLIKLYIECDSLYSLGYSSKHWKEDLVLLTAFVVALDKSGHWNELLALYDDTIKNNKIKPSLRMVDSSLRASIKVNDWAKFFSITNILNIFDNKAKKQHNDESKNLNIEPYGLSHRIEVESFISTLSNAKISEQVEKAISDFSAGKCFFS